jgi:hypothetical protein
MSNLESEWSFRIMLMITYLSQRHYSNSRYITYGRVPSSNTGTHKALSAPQFTAKSLNRQAKKSQKDENAEKARLKKVREPLPPHFVSSPPSVKEKKDILILTYCLLRNRFTGVAAGQQRWCTNIRRQCDPQKERISQLAPTRQPDRRRSEPGGNGHHDATSDRKHDKRSQRHGQSNGNHEPRARSSPSPPLPNPSLHG